MPERRQKYKNIVVGLILLFISTLTAQGPNLSRYNSDMSKRGKLSIATFNSRGMVTAIPYIKELMKDCDIISVCEHWLHANRLHVLADISDDFNVVARSSKFSDASQFGVRRGQGGVALFWRKSLKGATPINEITHDRICGLRLLSSEGINTNIFSVYLPSQGSSEDFDTILDEIFDIVNNDEPGKLSIICGDMNGDIGYLGGPKSTRRPTKQGRAVAGFFKNLSLFPTNLDVRAKGPINTFKGGMGSSTLDYIALPICMDRQLLSCEVLEDDILNLSDHRAVKTEIKFECITSYKNDTKKVPRVLWERIREGGVIQQYSARTDESAERILLEYSVTTCDNDVLDNILDEVVDALLDADKIIPRSKAKSHTRPFWNEKLSKLKVVKVRKYQIWKRNGSPRSIDNPFWIEHKTAKRDFRREIKRVQRDFEDKEVENIIRTSECDRNRFWRLIKKKRCFKQSSSIAITDESGCTKHEAEEVVQVWKEHFGKICSAGNAKVVDWTHHNEVTNDVRVWNSSDDPGMFLEYPFTLEEMEKAVKSLNKRKAPGYDSITAEHLQYAGGSMYGLLLEVFNRVRVCEYVPCNLRRGIQVPLFKGKNLSSTDPSNYRGITLLTSFNKVLEILIWTRMKGWWEDQRIISPLQGACRRGSSCIHSGLILQEAISVGLDTVDKVFVAYYDVAKAFDSVWIDGLFYQLR